MPKQKQNLNDPGWDSIFEKAGREHDIDPLLLKAIMFAESGPDKNAVDRLTITSKKGAIGPMQLLPDSFPNIDATDPRQAIPAVAKYIAEGLGKEKDAYSALMYYHGGPDKKVWGELTHAYPKTVLDYYQQLLSPYTTQPSGVPFPVQRGHMAPQNLTDYKETSGPGWPAGSGPEGNALLNPDTLPPPRTR